MLRGMEHEEPAPPTVDGSASPEHTAPKVRSEEALARSKDEVTPHFKEPKAPKRPGRWTPGRTVANR